MWSDMFYPWNPKRRRELIQKSQQLKDLMENNFRATNQLIDVMNKHLACSFEHITIDDSKNLKENCQVIIDCMHKIQAEVGKIDEKLKEKLDPSLYEQLKNTQFHSPKDFKAISAAVAVVCGVKSLQYSYVVCTLISSGEILVTISRSMSVLATGSIACIGLSVVFLGIDMIVEAILGSIERDHLEKALKEYDAALDEFKPASEKYQDKITYVRIKIEMMEEEWGDHSSPANKGS